MRQDEKLSCTCRCSFLEIYKEQVFDLLDDANSNMDSRVNLQVSGQSLPGHSGSTRFEGHGTFHATMETSMAMYPVLAKHPSIPAACRRQGSRSGLQL